MRKITLLFFLFTLIPQLNYCQSFFNTTEEYLSTVSEKTGFDKSKIVLSNFFADDSFHKDIFENHLFTFYGVVYNSEIASASQLSVKSCYGQFLKLCKSIEEVGFSNNNRKVNDVSYLKEIPFDKNKKTVIFLYSSTLTKRDVKNFIKPILEEIKKDTSFDYKVLSFDYSRIKSH